MRESAERFLAAEAGPGVVRAALEDPDAWRPLWDAVVELGWPSLAVPEPHGGLGLGAVDLVALAEVTGRWALPAPLMSTMGLAGPVLAATGADDAALAGVAEGVVTTLAVDGDITWDGHRLVGTARLVPDAVRAATVVVVAAGPDGPVVAAVPTGGEGVRIVPTHAADPNRPLADVVLDVAAPAAAADPEP